MAAEYSSILRLAAVSRGYHTSILTGERNAVKHAIGRHANLADGVFAVPFVTEVRRHYAQHVGSALHEDHSTIVAHTLKRAWLVSDFQTLGKIARNPAVLVCTQHSEEINGHLLVQHFPLIELLQQRHHLARG